jgi:hypothetical protein
MESKTKHTKTTELLTDEYIRSLPEELRQEILFKLHPFELFHLCTALGERFKTYCAKVIWPTLLYKHHNQHASEKHANVMWLYLSLFILNNRPNEFWFYPLDEHTRERPFERGYVVFNTMGDGAPFMLLYFQDTGVSFEEGLLVWKYFHYLFSVSVFRVEDDEYDLFGRGAQTSMTLQFIEESSDMVDVIYKLFELGFAVHDENLRGKDKRYYIRSEITPGCGCSECMK